MKIYALRSVESSSFHQLDPARQVISHDGMRRFAIATLERYGDYGLGWPSELVEPSLALDAEQSMLWLGIDERIVALNLETGRIENSLQLDSPLFDILWVDGAIAVICELEVLVLNGSGSLRFVQPLADIVANAVSREKCLILETMDGESLELNIQQCELRKIAQVA